MSYNPKPTDYVMVFSTVGHLGKIHRWNGRTRLTRDAATACGLKFRYGSLAHHWGHRRIFSESMELCRKCWKRFNG